jgi:A/G-specific adenine glycosylase
MDKWVYELSSNIPMDVDREFIEYVRRVVIDWYRVYGDRYPPWKGTSDPWSVLVATILLRVTVRSRVVSVYSGLLAKYPNPSSLACARIGDVEELVKPIGLHRVRARQLVELAKTLIEKYNGQIPCSRSELIKLPGVGDYTASVILLRVCKQPEPLLDTNTVRVYERLFNYKLKKQNPYRDKGLMSILEDLIPRDPGKHMNSTWE